MVRGKGAIRAALCAATALCAACLIPQGSAASASCASLSTVRSFSGTASLSFSGTASNGAGTQSVSIDHQASGIATASISQVEGTQTWGGGGHGGSVSISDSFKNTSGSGPSTGKQTATGPINAGTVIVSFSPATCTYTVKVSYQKKTNDTSGLNGGSTSSQVTDEAQSAAVAIPPSLALSGSMTVPASPAVPTSTGKGYYDFGSKPAWAEEMATLNSKPALGSATLSWSFTPTFKPPCTVPALAGEPIETARLELQVNNCATGTITQTHSSTITQGDVISSDPPAGSTEPNGTKVALLISSGPVPPPSCVVPKLRRHKLHAAKRALRRAHCGVGKIHRRHSRKIHKGRVISANPRAGTKHIHGYRVALVVSSGK